MASTRLPDRILSAARAHRLDVLGFLNAEPGDPVPAGTRSIILLGPSPRGFWEHLTEQPEWLDRGADPVDRWSRRAIGDIAGRFDAEALFPYGPAPQAPFIAWALRSGSAWPSPATLLVHDVAGLFLSFRGALALTERLPPAPTAASPCERCTGRPCVAACPVGALGPPVQYRLEDCHEYLSQAAGGQGCMTRGCAARRACPLSKTSARPDAQSAHHMKAFHP